MRVALFGGSFNPPHVGHQLAGLYVLETQPIDQLWLIPCFIHPFDKSLESFDDRFAMCERAAAALGARARVVDIERRLGGESRTLRTVKALQAEHPTFQFRLVIGSDLRGETAAWHGANELRALVPFIVVGRAGADAGTGPGVAMPDVSSTEIRVRLARGEAVDELVSRSVLDYIVGRTLYGGPESR